MEVPQEFEKVDTTVQEFPEPSYELYLNSDHSQTITLKTDNTTDKPEITDTEPAQVALPVETTTTIETAFHQQSTELEEFYENAAEFLAKDSEKVAVSEPVETDFAETNAGATEVGVEKSKEFDNGVVEDAQQVVFEEIGANEGTTFESACENLEEVLATDVEEPKETEVDNNESVDSVESDSVDAPDGIQSVSQQGEEVTIEEVSMCCDGDTLDIQPIVTEADINESANVSQTDIEGEFTIIAQAEETEPSEVIIIENPAQSPDDDLQSEATIEVIELTEVSDDPKKSDSPNLKDLKIPHHVLGRNMDKPVDDKFSNGRIPPKPRLGVKIPYRNLTSQIVSKQEIESVIMERARMKNAAHDPPAGGDVFFAKKLTQRLAKKIAPPVVPRKESTGKASPSKEAAIKDNSDLIAILEGDGDDWDVPQQSRQAEVSEGDSKKREKEIALKQLEQLPNRRRSGRFPQETVSQKKSTSVSKSTKPESDQNTSKSGLPPKTAEKLQELQKKHGIIIQKAVAKINDSQKVQNGAGNDAEAKDEDIEPRFSTNSVVKTYTRKRKPSDAVATLAKSVDSESSPKKPLKVPSEQRASIDLPANAYITKSSRVIKKKVIWDPDEAATPIKKNKSPRNADQKAAAKVESEEETSEAVETPVKEKKVTKTVEEKSPVKKISAAASPKKYKRLTEIDKLLMDEGAVNMLYDVKNTEDNLVSKQRKRKLSTISIDKAERDLLSKTKEIKNDLQSSSNRQSPKSLRKKESTVPAMLKKEPAAHPGLISRKKSKDSSRSSVHSPPASPGFYSQHAEASRIIRRHSSSSFSSEDDEPIIEAKESPTKPEKPEKPEKVVKKKAGIMDKLKKKESLSPEEKAKLNEEMSKSFSKLVESPVKEKYGEFTTFKVKVVNKVAQVVLNTVKRETFLSVQSLTELTQLLTNLETDDDCDVIALTSHGRSFCHGLDYKSLVTDVEDACEKNALETAIAVREFLRKLAVFPKFLGAVVDGNVVGVGVTMLPLFDMVLASDRATFSVPCAQLGCSEAGSSLLALPHLSNCAVTCELLYSSLKISADDAASHGLVTRTILPERFQEQAFSVLEMIAKQSQQSVRGTKKMLRQRMLATIEADLQAETEVLVEQWTSIECQENFAKYKPE